MMCSIDRWTCRSGEKFPATRLNRSLQVTRNLRQAESVAHLGTGLLEIGHEPWFVQEHVVDH
jgi:hypothetical protein